MDYRIVLGIIATLIGLFSYIPYFRDLILKKTKPHVFTWLIWGVLTAIAFVAQLSANGGPGAWVNGITTITCFVNVGFALKYGKKNIKPIDVLCLSLAVIAICWWIFAKDALVSIILVTIADILGFIPTFRKAYSDPYSETLITYFLSSTKYLISLFALINFSQVTIIFPLYLVIANSTFGVFSLIRRVQLKVKK